MPRTSIQTAIASLCLAISLGACEHSSGPAPVDLSLGSRTAYRVTLPLPPPGVEACLRRAFPEVPERDITTREVTRMLGDAILLDKAKTACGLLAVEWIKRVRRDYAR